MGEFILVTGYNTNHKIIIRIKDIRYCVEKQYYTEIHTYNKVLYEVKERVEQIFEMINKH